jgi:hypothetical protein
MTMPIAFSIPATTDWTVEQVAERLAQAADTLKRLPSPLRPARLTSWPSMVYSAAEIAGWMDATRPRTVVPSPRAVSEMDQALDWLLWLGEVERRLVWARACRLPWRKLAMMDGRSHVTLRKVVQGAHQQIVDRLP